jgi:hypothetical protein
MTEQRSPVHEIVHALRRALADLEAAVEIADVERWAFAIHATLSAAGREFHNHDHVIDFARFGDPIEVIAALYHDAVYIQVDQGPPVTMAVEMNRALGHDGDGWRVLPAAAAAEVTADVLAVFGRRPGDHITAMTGLNELASALVAAQHLERALDRGRRIALAACIEQTIPFRADPVTPLRDRLVSLGLRGTQLDDTLARAVRVGNRDVENFAENDPARFLDNTWKLLPESNPALHAPLVYTVRDYRIALQKMEGFLATLEPERVFHVWGDEPRPEIHARRVARTAGNLELAVRYLRAKLYAIALVEAIADATGGDVPLDYFMGALKHAERAGRIEQYLPNLSDRSDLDPPLHRLLAEGRASESSFDTKPSPLGAFLHQTVGEPALMRGVELARRWWAGASDARAFLASQPARPVAAIARAAANTMETRHDRLLALAEAIEAAA